MVKNLAEMTDAELEKERFDADVERYCVDYIDSFRQWRLAADAADERLAAVTTEISRREKKEMVRAEG